MVGARARDKEAASTSEMGWFETEALIGAKAVAHSRYVMWQMAEVAVPKELFAAILARIARLKEAPA